MKYANPILRGDYSDPDVIRVGEDFYMISSSFTYLPGIPVLHSRDLASWEIIGYAVKRLPFARYDAPAHGCGTWAPSLRYHNNTFYVYVCLPDEGLFAFTAADPAGEWECHFVKDVTGWIDPCPLFDEDGSAYLIHGFAASRVGIKNILYLHRMSPDGMKILDNGRPVYDGVEHGDETVEGPKLYKRNGLYWIFCPAGGVATGYQLALCAENIYGPYTRHTVLCQGDTPVNGPHQGGWVTDGRGGDWFIHFQDAGAYGRILHLQPVDWSSGVPVMGNGGFPVAGGDTGLAEYKASIPMSDDFSGGLGLKWQWQANPNQAWYSEQRHGLRLYAAPADSLFGAGNFLSQLMQAFDFDMEIRLKPHFHPGDWAGLGMMGWQYHYLAWDGEKVILTEGKAERLSRFVPDSVKETVLAEAECRGSAARLIMRVRHGKAAFAFAPEGGSETPVGEEYPMSPGGWTGARPGIFCMNIKGAWGGWADVEYCRVREAKA